VICYRHAAYATPLRTLPASQEGRFNSLGDDEPTQYLTEHPLGPLAELMRHADLRTLDRVMAVRTRTWALSVEVNELVEISFENAREMGIAPEALVADDPAPCRELARRLRRAHAGAIVPSAALPGTRSIVLFGPRVAAPYLARTVSPLDVAAGITAEGARPLAALIERVRFVGDPHAALEAWRTGAGFRFAEPDWSLSRDSAES
jgi:RES domain-containing protein